ADSRLGAAGNPSFIVDQTSLHDAISPAKWDRIGEIEGGVVLDQSEVRVRRRGIGNNPLDFSYCEIPPRIIYLSRLVVDDPITDTCFDTTQVDARELILLCWAIIVDRIWTVNENPESHDFSATL